MFTVIAVTARYALNTRIGQRVRAAVTRRMDESGMGTHIGAGGWALIAFIGVLAVLGVLHYVIIPWIQGVGNQVSTTGTTTTGTMP